MLSDRSLSGWKGWSGSFFSPSKQDEMRSPLLSNEFFASVQFNYSITSDRKNFHACLLSRLPFSFSLPLLSRLMEMAFVPVNLYILFFWGSKIGSVLSPLPWFMHSYFHLRGIDVPRPSRRRLQLFFISHRIFISCCSSLWSEDQFSLSFAAFIPACSLPHRPCILHACPSISPSLMAEGEPCSRLDRRGALPELEQACKN